MNETTEAIYSELAKWERHKLGHSPGYLNLSGECLWFVPHQRSILDKGFKVPVASIARVERSDNWLWRGAVNIYLLKELHIEFSFRLDPNLQVDGIEKPIFSSDKLRFFLGSKRKQFIELLEEFNIETKQ